MDGVRDPVLVVLPSRLLEVEGHKVHALQPLKLGEKGSYEIGMNEWERTCVIGIEVFGICSVGVIIT